MALGNVTAGPTAAEFQVSAHPFAQTGTLSPNTTTNVTFPYVTKFIALSCSAPMFLGFTQNGVASANRFQIPSGISNTFDLALRDLYIRNESTVTGTFNVLAGLTHIPERDWNFVTSSLFATGSNRWIYNGVG